MRRIEQGEAIRFCGPWSVSVEVARLASGQQHAAGSVRRNAQQAVDGYLSLIRGIPAIVDGYPRGIRAMLNVEFWREAVAFWEDVQSEWFKKDKID